MTPQYSFVTATTTTTKKERLRGNKEKKTFQYEENVDKNANTITHVIKKHHHRKHFGLD